MAIILEGTDYRVYDVDASGRVIRMERYDPYYQEGPSCSICDGLGHGYPGGPGCPLEGLELCEDTAREDRMGWT